jgi:hypothetical protein
LLLNGILKIPMQFLILSVGVLVFVFYQFTAPPLLFNASLRERMKASASAGEMAVLEQRWSGAQATKRAAVEDYLSATREADAQKQGDARARLHEQEKVTQDLRMQAKGVVARTFMRVETKDSDYIFITFVKDWLPSGLLGLLIAVILAAAMSSISSELNALGATTTVDFYKRLLRSHGNERQLRQRMHADFFLIRLGKKFVLSK